MRKRKDRRSATKPVKGCEKAAKVKPAIAAHTPDGREGLCWCLRPSRRSTLKGAVQIRAEQAAKGLIA